MRKFLIIIALSIVALSSCRREYRSDRAQWPPVTPEIDSLTYLLEMEMIVNRNMDSMTKWILELEKADHYGARSSLFRARLWRFLCNSDSSRAYIHKAKTMIDSIRDPYTWIRACEDEGRHSTSAFEAFKTTSRSIEFYRAVKDSLMLGNALVDMSLILRACDLPWQAYKYLEESQGIFTALKMPAICSRININKASILCDMGQQQESDSINIHLLSDPTIKNDPTVLELILRNLYVSTGDINYIKQDYAMIGDSIKPLSPLLYSLISDAYYRQSKPDSAFKYARMANDREDDITSYQHLILKDLAYAHALEERGMKDSACFYYHRLLDLQDSLEKISTAQDVLQLETNYAIALYEHQQSERAHSERMRWIGIVAIIIIICAVAAFMLYRRNQLEKFNKL